MGSIDFQITALHDASAVNAAENAQVPQTQAASPVLPARGFPLPDRLRQCRIGYPFLEHACRNNDHNPHLLPGTLSPLHSHR
jgi:hypothetical protein